MATKKNTTALKAVDDEYERIEAKRKSRIQSRIDQLVALARAVGLERPVHGNGSHVDIGVTNRFPGAVLRMSVPGEFDATIYVEIDAESPVRSIKLTSSEQVTVDGGWIRQSRVAVEYHEPTLKQIAEVLRLAGWVPVGGVAGE